MCARRDRGASPRHQWYDRLPPGNGQERLHDRGIELASGAAVRWQNKASGGRYGDCTGAKISIVVPDAGADVEAFLADILCHGAPAEFTIRVTLPDGRVEVREISAAPVRDGGSIVGIFGISAPAQGAAGAFATAAEHDLTDRQREVLSLLADGLSTQEIAAELGISATTARNHIANLMAALGVHTRLQAVLATSRAGLVEPRH